MTEYQPKSATFRANVGLKILQNGIKFLGQDVDKGIVTPDRAKDIILPFELLATVLGTHPDDIHYYLTNGLPGAYILSHQSLLE